MKLEKLRLFLQEINTELSAEGITASLYYYYEDKWSELDKTQPPNKQIKGYLDKCKAGELCFRPSKSQTAWFACSDINCFVSLTFNVTPQAKTLENHAAKLKRMMIRALNSYKVSHNQLTQLLARDSFRNDLESAMQWASEKTPLSGETEDAEKDRLLAVFAIDIDHFKQVNDTYGHLYGDQVLKTFAIRLEKCAKSISECFDVQILLAHPSGEEFQISVYGDINRAQVIEWANEFRKSICDEPLPNENEWEMLKEYENLTPIVVPPIHERNISASIGVAFFSPALVSAFNQTKITSILEDADTALYRAKTSGRNQVISFDEILNKCGRVLEHDLEKNIVAIDIGKNVGVALGQEFKVFPTDYTGNKKFTISDGRTTRTIGMYPRVEIATITIFDIQPELSFAYISDESKSNISLEHGASLEVIPTGSIGHLLTGASRYFPNATNHVKVGDSSALQDFIEAHSSSKIPAFSVVFRFSEEQEFLKKYGSAALNESLAKLFREVSAEYHSDVKVGILDIGSICVVGKGSLYKEAELNELFMRLKGYLPELKLKVGSFSYIDSTKDKVKKVKPLDPKKAIEYSRYAASDYASDSNEKIIKFSSSVAVNILNSHRAAKAYKQGVSDFESLRELGVDDASFYNVGGLLYSSINEIRIAADLFEIAMKLNPNNHIYKTNFGSMAYRISEFEQGLKVLNSLSDEDIDKAKEDHEYGYFMYALLLAEAKLRGLPSFMQERFYKMSSVALEMNNYKNSERWLHLKKAVES